MVSIAEFSKEPKVTIKVVSERTGVRIKWLTRSKVITRFLTAPFRNRDLFGESEH